jgi:hypothetical protein
LLAALSAAPSHASTFTYRGALSDRGVPAEGEYGFRLSFYAGQAGGLPIAPALTLDGVPVRGGAFATELALDPKVEARESLWVEVEVRDAKGNFVPLAERTEVRPKALAAGVCWDTQGNASTNPATDFLGTTDAQPLNLRAGNVQALRLEATGLPNVLGGASSNLSGGGATAASIGGGFNNKVSDNAAAVGGGHDNLAGNDSGTSFDAEAAFVGGGTSNRSTGSRSVVAGGISNAARGKGAAVPGGQFNCAGADQSFAGGYAAKVRPAVPEAAGSCAAAVVGAGPATTGDAGTFVWNADITSSLESTGPGQFLVQASGGVGINTNQAVEGSVAISSTILNGPPLLRLFNGTADQAFGGRVLISENASSSAGGYLSYDASGNVFLVGTNNGSADFNLLRMPRGTFRLGVGRTPAANALEVEGDASKTTATAWLANSDARIKQEIEPVAHALETLERVRPVTFRYTDAYRAAHPSIEDRRYYNVVAQEFAAVFPDAVKSSREALPGEEGEEILQVDVHPALITTIAATQELAAEVRALRNRLESMEAENRRLREGEER